MIVVSIDKLLNLGVEIFQMRKTQFCVAFPPSLNPKNWNAPSWRDPSLINEVMMTKKINIFYKNGLSRGGGRSITSFYNIREKT